jgi:hypothetical protein
MSRDVAEKDTSEVVTFQPMSALPRTPYADIRLWRNIGRYGPISDILHRRKAVSFADREVAGPARFI